MVGLDCGIKGQFPLVGAETAAGRHSLEVFLRDPNLLLRSQHLTRQPRMSIEPNASRLLVLRANTLGHKCGLKNYTVENEVLRNECMAILKSK